MAKHKKLSKTAQLFWELIPKFGTASGRIATMVVAREAALIRKLKYLALEAVQQAISCRLDPLEAIEKAFRRKRQ